MGYKGSVPTGDLLFPQWRTWNSDPGLLHSVLKGTLTQHPENNFIEFMEMTSGQI